MIYTSYFGNMRNIPKGVVCYSIAGKTPDWYIKMENSIYRTCPLLAPKYDWWKEWHDKFANDLNSAESKEWYSRRYHEAVLDRLNADAVVRLLNDHDQITDVCLLCYETPVNFCHRQLVADWLISNGIACKEL